MLERQDLATGKLEVLFQVGWSGAAVEGGVQGWGRGNSECWGRGTDATGAATHAPHAVLHPTLLATHASNPWPQEGEIVVPRGLGSGDGESDC